MLLHTYNRLDHLVETIDHGVVGVPEDGASSSSKANRIKPGDWILLRITDARIALEHLVLAPPLLVIAQPFLQFKAKDVNRWPELLWSEEKEVGKCIYPFRIPITHLGTPFQQLRIRFADLGDSGIRGRNKRPLKAPNQWGMKFLCNVLDSRIEIKQILHLLRTHSSVSDGGPTWT